MKTPSIRGEARELKDVRGRKTGKVEVSILGVSIAGDSFELAQGMVEDEISARVEQHAPYMLRFAGIEILIHWHYGQWHRAYIRSRLKDGTIDQTARPSEHLYGASFPRGMSFRDVVDECHYGIAQDLWNPGEAIPDICPNRKRGEFEHWMEFQNRYARARAKGLTDCDSHNYACGALARPDLIAAVETDPVPATAA